MSLKPTVATILFCYAVEKHRSGVWVIKGAMHHMPFRPGAPEVFGVYVLVDDLHGKVDLRWDFFREDPKVAIVGQPVTIKSLGPNDPADFGITIGPVALPGPGVYRFEVSWNGQPIGHRRLWVDAQGDHV